MNPITLDVTRHPDHLLVRWHDGSRTGACRFDHLPDAVPEWLGSADELLDGADRRAESRIVEAVEAWAAGAGLRLGLWHDDAGVELLGGA